MALGSNVQGQKQNHSESIDDSQPTGAPEQPGQPGRKFRRSLLTFLTVCAVAVALFFLIIPGSLTGMLIAGAIIFALLTLWVVAVKTGTPEPPSITRRRSHRKSTVEGGFGKR